MTGTYKEKALRYAGDLLDRYPNAVETPDNEGLLLLLSIAWLEGTLLGSDETVGLIQGELERAVEKL